MILCLETSGKACSVALAQHGQCLAYNESDSEWSHSRAITLMIEEVLAQAQVGMKDLKAVAISKGPGSYTGLRVGASCGKGLCYALDIPLISVPTLEIIASDIIDDHSLEEGIIVPMIDARRTEVYYNLYSIDLIQDSETTNLVLDESSFSDYSGKTLYFCGDGAFKMSDFISSEPSWTILETYAKASAMASLACDKLILQELEDIAYYVPFYLKPPNITKSKKNLI